MPDVKISALPEATSIASTDVAPVVTGGVTKKASAATIVNAVLPAPGAIGGTTPNSGAFTTLSASSTVSGTGFTNYLASPPAIGSTAANTGAFTTLSASSAVSGTGFTNYLASPPAIGGTTPSTGSFTTLSATSLTNTALTSGRITFASTGGLLSDSASLTWSGSVLSATNFSGALNGTVGATTPNTGAFTTLSASSTVSGTGFSTYLSSPPAIGNTAANTGAFTTLSASSTVSGTGFTSYLASPPAIGNTTANTGAFTTLSASSTVSGTGFSTYLSSPPAIGNTAANTGAFTTLSASGQLSLTKATDYNLYASGAGANYMAGALGLGATPGGDTGLKLAKNITGATTAFGCRGIQAIQSDVTTTSHQFISNPSTAAAAFTLGNLNHYSVFQGSIGSGSAVTTQRGFFANSSITGATNNYGFYGDIAAGIGRYNLYMNGTADNQFNGNVLIFGVGGLGYTTGSGGAVTQITSRTTGVTLNKTNGAITLVSAAGLATYQSFTVTNSTVAATDTIIINQKSGTDIYEVFITAVAAGSFRVTFATTGGVTVEQPVFNFAVIKAVAA